jgi:hypothetical protein
VVEDGRYLGMITLKELKQVPWETHKNTKVSGVYRYSAALGKIRRFLCI